MVMDGVHTSYFQDGRRSTTYRDSAAWTASRQGRYISVKSFNLHPNPEMCARVHPLLFLHFKLWLFRIIVLFAIDIWWEYNGCGCIVGLPGGEAHARTRPTLQRRPHTRSPGLCDALLSCPKIIWPCPPIILPCPPDNVIMPTPIILPCPRL